MSSNETIKDSEKNLLNEINNVLNQIREFIDSNENILPQIIINRLNTIEDAIISLNSRIYLLDTDDKNLLFIDNTEEGYYKEWLIFHLNELECKQHTLGFIDDIINKTVGDVIKLGYYLSILDGVAINVLQLIEKLIETNSHEYFSHLETYHSKVKDLVQYNKYVSLTLAKMFISTMKTLVSLLYRKPILHVDFQNNFASIQVFTDIITTNVKFKHEQLDVEAIRDELIDKLHERIPNIIKSTKEFFKTAEEKHNELLMMLAKLQVLVSRYYKWIDEESRSS